MDEENSKYVKVVIPTISKNYFNKKKGKGNYDKYKGKAYIIIDNKLKRIVFNTLLLDEEQTIIGAADGKYGEEYKFKKGKKYNELFKYRQNSFKKLPPINQKEKSRTEFMGEIKEFNKLILKYKLTIKDVDGFISGSNPTGGLTQTNSDPVRIYYKNDDLIKNKYSDNINEKKWEKIDWKAFSLISNISNRNSSFKKDISLEYLENLEVESIERFLERDDWFVYPYGKKNNNNFKVPFKESFLYINHYRFKKLPISNQWLAFLEDKKWNARKPKDDFVYIIDCIEDETCSLIDQLRTIWTRRVNRNINSNKFKNDFISGFPFFERAHIIENGYAKNNLVSKKISDEKKYHILKDLFNENNYLLLKSDIHDAWDRGNIYIDGNGQIMNINLTQKDFEILISEDNDNIYKTYPNSKN